ncbi:MAG TPA: hypothetical protein VL475_12945 [Planctomycetaceae bacterium]|nr:hypothetical protein [Planctomycetaceae bacterium]
MMQVMKDIGGVEVPDYLAKLSPENGVVPNGHPTGQLAAGGVAAPSVGG